MTTCSSSDNDGIKPNEIANHRIGTNHTPKEPGAPVKNGASSSLDAASVYGHFVNSLWRMVSDGRFTDCVAWTPDGLGIELKDKTKLTMDVLPLYFRSANFASFQRQLSYYGFLKKKRVYVHEHFVRGQPDRLQLVRRKTHREYASNKRLQSQPNSTNKHCSWKEANLCVSTTTTSDGPDKVPEIHHSSTGWLQKQSSIAKTAELESLNLSKHNMPSTHVMSQLTLPSIQEQEATQNDCAELKPKKIRLGTHFVDGKTNPDYPPGSHSRTIQRLMTPCPPNQPPTVTHSSVAHSTTNAQPRFTNTDADTVALAQRAPLNDANQRHMQQESTAAGCAKIQNDSFGGHVDPKPRPNPDEGWLNQSDNVFSSGVRLSSVRSLLTRYSDIKSYLDQDVMTRKRRGFSDSSVSSCSSMSEDTGFEAEHTFFIHHREDEENQIYENSLPKESRDSILSDINAASQSSRMPAKKRPFPEFDGKASCKALKKRWSYQMKQQVSAAATTAACAVARASAAASG